MRTECLNSRYLYNMALPVSRLVAAVGSSILGGCMGERGEGGSFLASLT